MLRARGVGNRVDGDRGDIASRVGGDKSFGDIDFDDRGAP